MSMFKTGTLRTLEILRSLGIDPKSVRTPGRASSRTTKRTPARTPMHRSTPLTTKPTLPVLPTEANYAATPKNGREGT